MVIGRKVDSPCGIKREYVPTKQEIKGDLSEKGESKLSLAIPPFPYLVSYNDTPAKVLFERLDDVDKLISLNDNEIMISHDAYHTCDKITDLYTEKARMKARVGHNQSPERLWATQHDSIRRHCQLIYGEYSLKALRETIYGVGREATLYKASLARFFCDRYCPDEGMYLDPFAGWGDRIIGALSSSKVKKYTGIDPNPNLREGYEQIIKDFGWKDGVCRGELITAPFESVKIEDESVDFILTSPPYYDFEIYTQYEDPSQSIANYHSYKNWFEDWMCMCLDKMYRALKKGCYLILYVGATYRCPTFTKDIRRVCLDMEFKLENEISRPNGARAGTTFVFKKEE